MKLESSDFNTLASVGGNSVNIVDDWGNGMRSVEMPETLVIAMVDRFAGNRDYVIEENFDHPVETNRELSERQLESLDHVNEVHDVYEADGPLSCGRCGSPECVYTSDRIIRRKGEEVGEVLIARCRDCMDVFNSRPEWVTTDPKVSEWCDKEGIKWVSPRFVGGNSGSLIHVVHGGSHLNARGGY